MKASKKLILVSAATIMLTVPVLAIQCIKKVQEEINVYLLNFFINKKIERRQVSNLSKNISAFQLYKHVIILQLICQ